MGRMVLGSRDMHGRVTGRVAKPAAAGLALALAVGLAPAAQAGPVVLAATLTPIGDASGAGNGQFRVEIDPDTNDFCYTLAVNGLGRVTEADVHRGAAGEQGVMMFTIEVTGAGNDMCVAVDKDKLDPVVANPSGFYIDVHTAAKPDGAIRGQLGRP